MNGCIILTTPRSGSNWLSELITNSGRMGNCTEWLHSRRLGGKLEQFSFDDFVRELEKLSSTDNGRFSFKLFPFHLYRAYHALGSDLIRELHERHDVSLAVLRRRDRLRQAISLARSQMTGAWTSKTGKSETAKYDFDRICHCYFTLERSNNFWSSYLDLHEFEHSTFYYEDMIDDPMPCVSWIASRLEIEPPMHTDKIHLRIQRDATTEDWVARFRNDLARGDILRFSEGREAPSRSPGNLLRLMTKAPLKPYQV